MGILSFFRREAPPKAVPVRASTGLTFSGLTDPALLDYMRSGGITASGATVTPEAALKNTTVMRCVSLISFSVGMLPLHLHHKADKLKADDHPLFRILHRKPNSWQTAFEFRSLMQMRALTHGDAFALIVRSGKRIVALVPLDPKRVRVKQHADWSLTYTLDGLQVLPQSDVFHLRYGLSEDGFTGLSMIKQAAEAIGLALQAERATARVFERGVMAGLALEHPGQLSPEAFARLSDSLSGREGAENAGKSFILEEGMKLSAAPTTARDAQTVEQRSHQIEEVARVFGVPRPLLGVDDTSWGSGIDVLGQMFVQYGLNPWFEAWQQAIERDLLTEAEADQLQAKFNPGGLLRGSMQAQSDFFAKALGSGGHAPWMTQGEVRDTLDMPQIDLSHLPAMPGQQPTGAQNDAS